MAVISGMGRGDARSIATRRRAASEMRGCAAKWLQVKLHPCVMTLNNEMGL